MQADRMRREPESEQLPPASMPAVLLGSLTTMQLRACSPIVSLFCPNGPSPTHPMCGEQGYTVAWSCAGLAGLVWRATATRWPPLAPRRRANMDEGCSTSSMPIPGDGSTPFRFPPVRPRPPVSLPIVRCGLRQNTGKGGKQTAGRRGDAEEK